MKNIVENNVKKSLQESRPYITSLEIEAVKKIGVDENTLLNEYLKGNILDIKTALDILNIIREQIKLRESKL